MKVFSMNNEKAEIVSNWTYEEPYSIYSFDGSNECMNELMNGSYFYVLGDCEELIGYVCYGCSACVPAGFNAGAYSRNDIVDIGLGMRPDLCGKGMGLSLLKAGLDYARELFNNDKFRLTVATFNKRAVKVYERAGFSKEITFVKESEKGSIEFQAMIYE
jgi:RimJ/RimL family protein N-acetyltransferase